MGFEFYHWQDEAIKAIKGQDAILSSPTGTGKSICAYHWAGLLDDDGNPQKPKMKVIFTAPIKALSNERYMSLKALGFDAGIETGDYKWNADAPILCCTQEIYTLKYVDEPVKLIVDEFHYIFTEDERARAYIDGIYNTHPLTSLLIMSATFGNVERLRQYLRKISKRDFIVFDNHERITELQFMKRGVKPQSIKNAIVFVFSKRGIDAICQLIADSRKKLDGERRHLIYQMAKILDVEDVPRTMRFGVGPYYGRMLPKEKLLVERCYRAGLIDVIVGTDALALGLNLPAETVVFGQLVKFKDGPIGKNHFLQLAGRAGRKGFYDKGYVTYLDLQKNKWECRGYDTEQEYKKLLKKEPESAEVCISPKLGDLIIGKAKPSDEASYISSFSLPKVSRKESTALIMNSLQNLEDILNKVSGGNKMLKSEIKDMLGITWDSSLTFKNNVDLAVLFVESKRENILVPALDIVEIFERQEKNELNGLLRAKCFIKSLGLERFVSGIEDIDYEVELIDPTVFEFEQRNKKIDEFLEKNTWENKL